MKQCESCMYGDAYTHQAGYVDRCFDMAVKFLLIEKKAKLEKINGRRSN
jgi:hypothetical protein